MDHKIRRRESTGSGPNTHVETETLAKFELMDSAPVRGESIPVRLFLIPYELTPTYRNINNKFSVKYYLNLVLVDEEDRRYFKQQPTGGHYVPAWRGHIILISTCLSEKRLGWLCFTVLNQLFVEKYVQLYREIIICLMC